MNQVRFAGGPPPGAIVVRGGPMRGGPIRGGPGPGLWFGSRPDPVKAKELPRLLRDSVDLLWSVGRGRFILAVGTNLLATALRGGRDLSGGQAVEAIVASGGRPDRATVRSLVTAGGLQVGDRLVQLWAERAMESLEKHAAREMERRIIAAVVDADLAELEDPKFLDQLQRATHAAHPSMLVRGLISVGGGTAGALAAGVVLAVADPLMVPATLAGELPSWWFSGMRRPPGPDNPAVSSAQRERGYLYHMLTTGRTAKELLAFGAGDAIRDRHDEVADRLTALEIETASENNRRQLVATAVSTSASVPILAVLARRVLKGGEVGKATAAAVASRQLSSRIGGLMGSVTMLGHTASAARGFREFTQRVPARARRQPAGALEPAPPFGAITVDNISFTYPRSKRPVLDGVSLEIGVGETVALVGDNGCGKSTLAKLLCFLYQPDAGRILWDGVDTARSDPADLRQQLSVVFQDFNQYALTAATNIGIGRPDRIRDRDAVVAAARLAGADGFLSALPDGYDTMLSSGFGGVELSTGQWQRVALARAFIRDAPMVILDEPTASLDARAEHQLFETVRTLWQDRTALLISHRLSSVRTADRIFVLAGGRIVESGNHDELMGEAGIYAELFELQSRSYR